MTPEILEEYNMIVNEEYKKILYYCLTNDVRQSMFYNLINKGLLQ